MASTTESIAAEVRAALARPRKGATDVAQVLKCSPSAASRKINGHVPFKAADLVRIADMLGVDVARFYSPTPPDVAAPATSAYTDVA